MSFCNFWRALSESHTEVDKVLRSLWSWSKGDTKIAFLMFCTRLWLQCTIRCTLILVYHHRIRCKKGVEKFKNDIVAYTISTTNAIIILYLKHWSVGSNSCLLYYDAVNRGLLLLWKRLICSCSSFFKDILSLNYFFLPHAKYHETMDHQWS